MQEITHEDFPEIQSNRYRVVEVLGAGAVGTVYKAEDTVLGTTVAIKKLHKTAANAEAVRFQREAKLAGSLTHPNVLSVFNFGFTEKQEPYLVLSYVEGQNLAERIQQQPNQIELTEALEIFIQIASGLSYAHQKHVVHRDIKPSNIMLISKPSIATERVKIVDFGLAKSKLDDQELTRSGVGLGTPLYMSPEQLEGAKVDARSDLYSFGCVMYEVLTGEPPFTADSVFELMSLKLDGGMLSVIRNARFKIPSSLEVIVNLCLRAHCDERYQNAGEILRDLEHVRAEHLGLSGIVPESTIAPKVVSKIDWPPILFVAAAVLLFVGVAVVGFSSLSEKPVEVKIEENKYRLFSEENVYGANTSTDEELKRFLDRQQGQSIKEITILGSKVTTKGYEQLTGHNLRTIILKGGSLDRPILKSLAKVTSLKSIKLVNNEFIDADAFVELARLPYLTELNLLDQEHITAAHIDAISVLPLMRRVAVHHTQCKISGGFKNWKRLSKLRVVMLDYTDVQDSDIADLVDIPLHRLTLDLTAISSKVIDSIVKMKTLEAVSFQKAENITELDYNRLRKLRPDVEVSWKFKRDTKLPMSIESL